MQRHEKERGISPPVMYQAGYKYVASAEVYMNADTNTLSEKVQKFFAVKLN
ncbi:MAG: hypothetical protein ACKOXB_02245 [Flavobacteriales bacterium]